MINHILKLKGLWIMYRIISNAKQKYLELLPDNPPMSSEDDALNLVATCYENNIFLVMLFSNNLSSDFFNLRSGLAGKIMLKLSMHGIKVVAVIEQQHTTDDRFAEMAMEGNHFNNFGFFYNREQAENWLLTT